jgi:hypothetical protein
LLKFSLECGHEEANRGNVEDEKDVDEGPNDHDLAVRVQACIEVHKAEDQQRQSGSGIAVITERQEGGQRREQQVVKASASRWICRASEQDWEGNMVFTEGSWCS